MPPNGVDTCRCRAWSGERGYERKAVHRRTSRDSRRREWRVCASSPDADSAGTGNDPVQTGHRLLTFHVRSTSCGKWGLKPMRDAEYAPRFEKIRVGAASRGNISVQPAGRAERPVNLRGGSALTDIDAVTSAKRGSDPNTRPREIPGGCFLCVQTRSLSRISRI